MNRTARDGWYDFYSYNLLMGNSFSQLFAKFVDGKALLYNVNAVSINYFQYKI